MSGSSDYTRTAFYNLYKPAYDADVDMWGTHLNANADVLDSTLHGLSAGQAGAPFLPLNGVSLVNAANDAAAATAGVTVGGLYRNGSVVMVRVA